MVVGGLGVVAEGGTTRSSRGAGPAGCPRGARPPRAASGPGDRPGTCHVGRPAPAAGRRGRRWRGSGGRDGRRTRSARRHGRPGRGRAVGGRTRPRGESRHGGSAGRLVWGDVTLRAWPPPLTDPTLPPPRRGPAAGTATSDGRPRERPPTGSDRSTAAPRHRRARAHRRDRTREVSRTPWSGGCAGGSRNASSRPTSVSNTSGTGRSGTRPSGRA